MEFLTFRKMVTPIFIQLLFWLGVIGAIGTGIFMMTMGDELALGLVVLLLGPLAVRIYAELLIVMFRIHSALNELVKVSKDAAASSQPAATAPAWQQSAAQPATGYGQQAYGQQAYGQQTQQQTPQQTQQAYTQPSPPPNGPSSTQSDPPQGPPPSGPPSA